MVSWTYDSLGTAKNALGEISRNVKKLPEVIARKIILNYIANIGDKRYNKYCGEIQAKVLCKSVLDVIPSISNELLEDKIKDVFKVKMTKP